MLIFVVALAACGGPNRTDSADQRPSPQETADTYVGTVDGTAYDPDPEAPTGVYPEPNQQSAALYRAENGEQLTATCILPGERIRDSRSYSSEIWYRVDTPEGIGYIPRVWFGRDDAPILFLCTDYGKNLE